MADYKIFSGDSHMSEPGDLWVERIDQEYRWRAPRIEKRERNGKTEDVFLYEGWPPHPVGVGLGAAAYETRSRTAGAESFRSEGKGYEDARPGGWDPAERLKDQDIDGVDGEVLYTTLGFRQFWIRDAGLQRACFRAYNDWLSEFCSYSPNRLIGLSLISMYDVDEAIAELQRTAVQGHKGAMIGTTPPPDCPPYHSSIYEPFWAAAQDLDMTLVWHENTGGHESRPGSGSSYWEVDNSIAPLIRFHEVQRALGHVVVSGVLDRFPKLRLVVAEQGTDWIPFFVRRMERIRGGKTSYGNTLSMKPVELLRRQVYFTYTDDPEIVQERELVGVDNLLFATDYPHSASCWPRSQETVASVTAGILEGDRRKLVRDNTLRVFNISAPVHA
jgi:predicted TIM-barrel fold metal-dependent hydrolase